MAAKLSSCLLRRGIIGGFSCDNIDYANRKPFNMQLSFLPSHRLLPASCKVRQRNLSSRYKRQVVKKASRKRIPTTSDPLSSDEDSEPENSLTQSLPRLNHEMMHEDNVYRGADADHADELPSVDSNMYGNLVDEQNQSSLGVPLTETSENGDQPDEQDLSTVNVPTVTKSLATIGDSGQQLSGVQLEGLIGMIKNAERNILLLNQARVHALEDLQKILAEKEALKGEINILEMRLTEAEADAQNRVASQEKINVEHPEDQLEKLRNELIHRGGSERTEHEMLENQNFNNGEALMAHDGHVHSLSKEIDMLRMENLALRNDIQALKTVLGNIRNTDERIVMLENEHYFLESSLKDLRLKLSVSQEDVSKLSNLESECKDLWSKVENLQLLLDKASKHADQAISVLQQSQELQKKVDNLEVSLEEANVYKLSS
ncbi:hypothetical protein SLA2020_240960 [Shorea laevis]